ncbi:MAG: FtsH protease activity modulator HflK [Verrucomicrobia bacterium]|nr:FtsH protease activity modulator HflK [Verrucomicrobiota bacterium]MCF7708501.1 FtsH protease activity modulator HflK [Verrucomicrobiota bacterium]
MERFSDLEKSFREFTLDNKRLLQFIPAVIIGILLIWGAATSWFTIDPEEEGVVLRFGKHTRTVEPGLHFKIPWGIEKVYPVPVKRQLKEEFGFRTTSANVRSSFTTAGREKESEMLTGDLNVANVEWTTQYMIVSPFDYLFKVRNLVDTFRDMNEAVVREIVGDRTINEILTTGRIEIESEVEEKLQQLCKQYEMGIKIYRVNLQDVNPPEPVKPAFNEVNQAQQEKEKMINEAFQQYNKVIPKAKGEAERIIEEARGYAVQRTNIASGEASRFNAIFSEYQKAPEVTTRRIYLETMETVMTNVARKIIIDEQASGILPLLNLNQQSE